MIRNADISDASAIADIYNYYVTHTTATFEETPVSAEVIATRMADVKAASLPWIVFEQDGAVLGYAYATKWKARSAYRYSVESTVYLAKGVLGSGYGTALYQTLFHQLKELGINAVIGGITLPNPSSIALHEKLGMRKVAHFDKVGFKFSKWLDVGYWQCCLIDM